MMGAHFGAASSYMPSMPRIPMPRVPHVRMPSAYGRIRRPRMPRPRGGFRATFRTTHVFFDEAVVLSYMNKKTRRVFSHFGGYVARTARNSMVYKDGPSDPGEPPHSHKPNAFIRKGLGGRFGGGWGFDLRRQSVVIGPGRLNAKNAGQLKKLEEGGMIWIREMEWRRVDGKNRRKVVRSERKYTKARPFMGPALDKTLPKLPGFWADASK